MSDTMGYVHPEDTSVAPPHPWQPGPHFYHWPPPGVPMTSTSIQMVGVPICPDLVRYEQIGAADNLRGRVVRVFFWLMRWWPNG